MDDDTKPSFLKTSTPVLGFLTFDDTCNSKCSLEYIERKLARIDYLGRDILRLHFWLSFFDERGGSV